MLLTPHKFQRDAAKFILSTRRCYIGGEMGVGKTIAAVMAIKILKTHEPGAFPVLVIGPKQVATIAWPSELDKWDICEGLRYVTLEGDKYQRKAKLTRALGDGTDIFLVNYEQLPWLVDAVGIGSWPFKTVICDEATKLKAFRTKRGGSHTRGLDYPVPTRPSAHKSRSQALARVAAKADRWVCLSGTPAPNGLQDLWGQYWFLDGGARLGATFSEFQNANFAYDGGYKSGRQTLLPGADIRILSQIQDITMVIASKDVLDLPPISYVTVSVELSAGVMRQYKKFAKELKIALEKEEVAAENAASKAVKLLQIANGAVYLSEEDDSETAREWEVLHDDKIAALREVIAKADSPMIVAYHFRSCRERLLAAFPQAKIGSKANYLAWNAGEIPILLLHPDSGGHGLSLQYGGCNIAFFSHWWKWEARAQIIERIGPARQAQSGLHRPVTVYSIVAAGTVDEVVLQRHVTHAATHELIKEHLGGL